jgi:phosphoribosylamine---glycine ligase
MKVLVIGSGGREHALAWKIAQSPRVTQIFIAPGNAGTAEVGKNVPIEAHNLDKLLLFAEENGIALTIVGPDDALAHGIVDLFSAAGLRIFGPTRAASRLEWSKAFAKEFMTRHGIPTARFKQFDSAVEARQSLVQFGFPVAIKADGLALGKGVVIARDREEAENAIQDMMERRRFGEAGSRVVIEEYLSGPECSLHALIDGESYALFPSAQDHKQLYDGSQGPNTGGMGTFSPSQKLTGSLIEQIRHLVLDRFMAGLKADGIRYSGLLFPGLILTAEGPKVLEFNCRFGDPETQVLMARLRSDLVDLLEATIDGQLATTSIDWSTDPAVCVVIASGGYPGYYETGKVISGLAETEKLEQVQVFHAGTRREKDRILTAGGRVLGVTASGSTLDAARQRTYEAVEKIGFDGRYFRRDIAAG